jgi:hypothetical protein
MLDRSIRYIVCLLIASAALCRAAEVTSIIVSLADPAKLATLGQRGANPRVQKITYWLEIARRDGDSPEQVMEEAMNRIGWNDDRGRLTTAAMLRNVQIATKLGCTDDEGMEHMRHGRCAIVKNGPCAGDILSVDHIVPRALYPQLDNVLANLELMPFKLNRAKSASFGQRQNFELTRFRSAGLIQVIIPTTAPTTAPVAGPG